MYLSALKRIVSAFQMPAGPAHVIPIFKGDKPLDASGRPLRKSLTLPNWSKLAGKDRLELDLQLSCPGASDAGWLGVGWS